MHVSDNALEANQVAGFVTLVRNLVQSSPANQDSLVRTNAMGTLSYLLQKVRTSLPAVPEKGRAVGCDAVRFWAKVGLQRGCVIPMELFGSRMMDPKSHCELNFYPRTSRILFVNWFRLAIVYASVNAYKCFCS